MSASNRKPWMKPALVVIARNNPEEAVLTGCKAATVGASNSSFVDNCSYWDFGCYICDNYASS